MLHLSIKNSSLHVQALFYFKYKIILSATKLKIVNTRYHGGSCYVSRINECCTLFFGKWREASKLIMKKYRIDPKRTHSRFGKYINGLYFFFGWNVLAVGAYYAMKPRMKEKHSDWDSMSWCKYGFHKQPSCSTSALHYVRCRMKII
jgi:hypothetical protein